VGGSAGKDSLSLNARLRPRLTFFTTREFAFAACGQSEDTAAGRGVGAGSHPLGRDLLLEVEGLEERRIAAFKEPRCHPVGDLDRHPFMQAHERPHAIEAAGQALIDAGAPVPATAPEVACRAFGGRDFAPVGDVGARPLLDAGEDVPHAPELLGVFAHHPLARIDVAARGDGDLLPAKIAAVARVVPALEVRHDLRRQEVDVDGPAVAACSLESVGGVLVPAPPEIQSRRIPGGEEIGVEQEVGDPGVEEVIYARWQARHVLGADDGADGEIGKEPAEEVHRLLRIVEARSSIAIGPGCIVRFRDAVEGERGLDVVGLQIARAARVQGEAVRRDRHANGLARLGRGRFGTGDARLEERKLQQRLSSEEAYLKRTPGVAPAEGEIDRGPGDIPTHRAPALAPAVAVRAGELAVVGKVQDDVHWAPAAAGKPPAPKSIGARDRPVS